MKNFWKIILIILGLIGLIILIYFLSRPKPMNKFTFPDTVVVNNYTKFEIDTIVKVLINKVFEHDSITFNIFYINNEMIYSDFKIMAYIQPIINDRTFVLFIDKDARYLNRILSHEFVHFDQYIKNELILINQQRVAIYKGDTISLLDVPYKLRAFEKDAYNREYKVLKELNSLLYDKLN